MKNIEINCVQKTSSCRQYIEGKCPVEKVEFALGVPGVSFEGAADVLKTEPQLLPRNEIYGVGLGAQQLKEAGGAVVTVDCVFNRKCSVLIRNNNPREDSLPAKVVTAGWISDRQIKTGKGKLQSFRV